jgi:hypothetical protein
MLLLETGLLAFLYAPLDSLALAPFDSLTLAQGGQGRPRVAEPNPVVRWVLWSLAFKLTFLSGITKILSGDPSWANWTAMTFHYETQPLPAWTSWYAHQVPRLVHYWSVPAMFASEIAAPFAIFLPPRFRRTRLAAIVAMILLQAGIGATGNYGFFNILTIVLYLALLDDDMLRTLRLPRPPFARPTPERASGGKRDDTARPGATTWRRATSAAAIALAMLSAVALVREMEYTAGTRFVVDALPVNGVMNWIAPFRSVNGYGLFRVMTTERPEIVIEVSTDGEAWKEYAFRWKPGDVQRRPSFVEPHMPRLDWQMWFAALDPLSAQPWLARLAERILDGEPEVARLLGPNPLGAPARFVRLVSYDYRFTTGEQRASTGAWWNRTFMRYLTGAIPGPKAQGTRPKAQGRPGFAAIRDPKRIGTDSRESVPSTWSRER